MKRSRLSVVLLLGLAAAAAPAAAQSVPPEKVSITIPARGMDFVFLAVADKRGFFKDEGLDAAIEQATATIGVRAVVAGQYDFTASVGSGQTAIVQGAPLKVVMVNQDRPFYGFFAKAGIPTVKDLKGKKLGITSIGSAAHIMANLVLEKNGLDPRNDVVWVALGPPQNLWPALRAGSVDAAMIGSGDIHRPGKDGFVDLQVYKDPSARNASVGLTTSERFLREKPDVVKRLIRASLKAVQFMKANRAGTVPIMAEFMKLSAQEAGELYDLTVADYIAEGYVDDQVLRQSIDVLKVGMNLKEAPPVARVFDLKLAREAHDELRRQGWKP